MYKRGSGKKFARSLRLGRSFLLSLYLSLESWSSAGSLPMGNAPGRLRNTTSKQISSKSCHSSSRSRGQVSPHVSSGTRVRSFSAEGTPGQSSGNSIV